MRTQYHSIRLLFHTCLVAITATTMIRCSGAGDDGSADASVTGNLTLELEGFESDTKNAVKDWSRFAAVQDAMVACPGINPVAATSIIGMTINYKLPASCANQAVNVRKLTLDFGAPPKLILAGLDEGAELNWDDDVYTLQNNTLIRKKKKVNAYGHTVTVKVSVTGSVGLGQSDVVCPDLSYSNYQPVGPGPSYVEVSFDVDNGFSTARVTGTAIIAPIPIPTSTPTPAPSSTNIYTATAVLDGLSDGIQTAGICTYFITDEITID